MVTWHCFSWEQAHGNSCNMSWLQKWPCSDYNKIGKVHNSFVLPEVPRPSPLSATRDDTPHDGQSLASPTLTPTVDSSSSPAWGGGVRTSYDDQSSYKVDAEISETEGRQSVSSAGPVHNDNNKTGLKKKSSTTSSHSALRGAKSNVVGSRSEGRMPRKAGPPQVRNGKGADAMSPRKQKAVAGRTSDYPSPPHSPLLDAFMVPYRRTTSATLPQQQDPPTSHLGASQFDHAKPGSGLHVRANQPHPTGLVPMYRSGSLNLEDGQGSEHSSKQRKPAPSTSTARKKQGKFVSGGVKRSPTAEAGPSLPQRASNKETKRTIDVVPTGAMTKVSGLFSIQTHCGGNIDGVIMFPKRWLVLPRATFVADTKNVSKNLQKHFSCPHGAQQCCRVFPRMGNIVGHNVVATRLAGALESQQPSVRVAAL